MTRPGNHILVERPGVVVHPFSTDGGGSEEVALAGAITHGVTFALGRPRWLDVIVPEPLRALLRPSLTALATPFVAGCGG